MYTHTRGYKFCIGVDADGLDYGRGESSNVNLWAMPGEDDNQLKWPTVVKFTKNSLINEIKKNAVVSCTLRWDKPTHCSRVGEFKNAMSYTKSGTAHIFLDIFMLHSEIYIYLAEDSLHFFISKIEVLS